MKLYTWYVFTLLICLLPLEIMAQKPIYLTQNQAIYKTGLNTLVLENPQGNLTFQDILSESIQAQFQASKQEVLNYGYSKSSFWLKLVFKDTSKINQTHLIQFAHPLADSVSFYALKKGKIIKIIHTGGILPFNSREINDPTFLFELPVEYGETLTVYLNCRGKSSKQLPINVFSEKSFLETSRQQNTFLGLYVGFFLAMIFYNLFLYISLRKNSYLYYILCMSASLLLQLALSGNLHEFFPSAWIHIANLINLFWVGFSVYFGNQFAKDFLRVKHYAPKVLIPILIIDIVSILVMGGTLLSIYIPYLLNFLPLLSSILALSIVFVLFPTGIYIWRKGFRPARFYTLAFTALFAGILIYTFRNLGIIPNNLFTTSAVKLGSVLEALLLSLGLADRVNIAEKEKQEAQTETISALQEKESLISNQNKLLEEKVTQRTQEISSKNELLENQNEEIITKNHEIGKQRDSLAQKSEELTETLDELKTKNQEVISSINYAQRIQNAMLPQPEEIKTILPHSFVLFKPKDIVSGDFYWLIKKENKIIVAVVDCTGHGVPGAFMSMIGNDLLNEIVGFRGITKPDLILNALHRGVRQVLRQEETQNNDGMDMSICVIDTQSGILEYAGAKSPLVYIQQGHLSFIRGDKLPIGGSQGPSTREYTKRILQIQEGDVLYLFSDGFADQFGGPNQKKFMIKHFRELLHSIHEKPIHQQKEILNKVLEDWKGKEKQVDDILVLGIKFTQ